MSRKHLIIAAVVIAVIVVVGVANRQAQRFWFSAAAADAEPVTIVVVPGDTLSSIVPAMDRAGLVNAFWFKVYAKFSGRGSNEIRPGTYTISPGNAYASILGLLRAGNESDVAITFPEGFTLVQMGERVNETFDIPVDEWRVATGQFSPLEQDPFVVAAGKPDDVDLEGYLFPDTYRFSRDATAEDIAETMIDEMQKKYEMVMSDPARMFSSYDPSIKEMTAHEYLTLASIVEKEVRTPETMAMVADIFFKRLNIGMALQSDATINYVTGGDDPSVSLQDLEIDSLYNTYKHAGLPPGPISNAGLNALAAVATPSANPYYYFLTTDDGDVHYAETHDAHVANKARYLR